MSKNRVMVFGPKDKKGYACMWKLLLEKGCQTVIMLNTPGQKNKEKYWPSIYEEKTYGLLSVKCTLEAVHEKCFRRTFSIHKVTTKTEAASARSSKSSGGDQTVATNKWYHLSRFRKSSRSKRERGECSVFLPKNDLGVVTQMQYTDWSETRVPDVQSLLMFLSKVRAEHKKGSGPLVVHCRRDGFTGTFIALHMLINEIDSMVNIDQEKEIDTRSFLEMLRNQRDSIVEDAEQYKFLHEALLKYATDLLEDMKKRQATVSGDSKTKTSQQEKTEYDLG